MGITTEADAGGRAGRKDKQDRGGPAGEFARALGRMLWEHDFEATHPAATQAEKQASWQEARHQYVRLGRTLYQRLRKRGFAIEPGAATDHDDGVD